MCEEDTDVRRVRSVRERGVRRISVGGGLSVGGTVLHDVGPCASEWLPKLFKKLLPTTVEVVRNLLADYDPTALQSKRPRNFVWDVLLDHLGGDEWTPENAQATEYAIKVTEYAVKYANQSPESLSTYHEKKRDALRDDLTNFGAGNGRWNLSFEELERGPIALHELASQPPVVTLFLDAQEWVDLEDNRTASRALDVIESLASGFDIRLVMSSPKIERYFESAHSDWFERHLRLTEPWDTRHSVDPIATSEDVSLQTEAWNALKEIASSAGRIRLLAYFSEDDVREVRDLKADTEISLSDGAIDRYLGDLEVLGLIDVDRSERYNRLTLTSLGTAAQQYISADYELVHPLCSTPETRLTPTPHGDTSTVYRAADELGGESLPSTEVVDTGLTAEDWLADTGDPDKDADYIQWLDGPSDRLDAWSMHERLSAGQRAEGVTLVDDSIEEFDDGRVSYLSCFEDHVQVVCQWGRSLPTLARIAATLLSDRAMNKILTPSRLGNDLSNLFEESFETTIEDVLFRGTQLGWLPSDFEYDSFRDRYTKVRSLLLHRVGKLAGKKDCESRRELYNDLQGLITSATHLYRAAGVDVTIHIRVPNPSMIERDDQRKRDYLNFFKYTVPKNAAYGVHSAYRMLFEHRPEKLQSRMGVHITPDEPTAELTANWVISGPGISDMKYDIADAIESETERVREAIREGGEEGIEVAIPVVTGNSYVCLKDIIRRHINRKGYVRGLDYKDISSLVRLCQAVLGTETRDASPYDVAEVMLALAKRKPGTELSVSDIAYGIGELSSDKILPNFYETQQKMVKALLQADRPLSRSEIIDRANISESSYDRRWRELAAFDLVERTDENKWVIHLETWWATTNEVEYPFESDERHCGPLWNDVLYEAVGHLDPPIDYSIFSFPIDLNEVLEAAELQHWRPYFDWMTNLYRLRDTTESEYLVTLGERPIGAERDQQQLPDSETSED